MKYNLFQFMADNSEKMPLDHLAKLVIYKAAWGHTVYSEQQTDSFTSQIADECQSWCVGGS